METRAYNQLYLNRAARAAGNMLHSATVGAGMDGTDFLVCFVQSGIAEQFEEGNPRFVAGMSGSELFAEVMERTTGRQCTIGPIEHIDKSPQYWVGWILAQYQWYSGRNFKNILETIPYEELLSLYGILHEADVKKSCDVLDGHFSGRESRLKTVRKRCGMTQEELAAKSGVSLNTIRAYERRSKDINRAGYETVARLAKAMYCDIKEIVD